MNIGEMLINKKVIEEAEKLQHEILKAFDALLLHMHYCMIGKQPNFALGMDDETLEKNYLKLSSLRKLLSVSTENFINIDIDEVIKQIPNECLNFKRQIGILLSERADR